MGSAKTPRIEENRSFNLFTSLWIVPLVTLAIAGWLIYQHYTRLGPEIRVDFPSSNGLIAGESLVKYRDVIIGHVSRIGLQEKGKGVQVYIRMEKEAEAFLNETTHFWIVSPQVDYRGVRGLDTLLKGTYISMSARRSDAFRDHFIGQLEPYRSPGSGFTIRLHARRIGNIHEGAPVNYRHLRVGNIDRITLDTNTSRTEIELFIKKEYANLINITTKFWHQDLVSVSMEGGNLALDLAPLNSVLLGSISFESRFDKAYPPPKPDRVFKLYSRRSEAMKQHIGSAEMQVEPFRFIFTGDVSGLDDGTPIRFQGFKVGRIDTVSFRYVSAEHGVEAEATGRIDVGNFQDKDHNGTHNLIAATGQGLRAYLRGSNLLFDNLYVDLDYPRETNQTAGSLVKCDGFWDFPTQPRKPNTVLADLNRLLDNLSDLATESKKMIKNINGLTEKESFQTLSDDLNKTMGSLRGMMGGDSDLSKAIADLRKTLKTTKSVLHGYSSGSLFGKKLEAMLREVGRTSEETKRFIEKLNKKPNALIFGE